MNEKYQSLINECVSRFPDHSRHIFLELSEYAVSLGYTPKWVKVRHNGKSVNGDALTFTKNKVKKMLIRISPEKNPHAKDMPCLALRYFASSDYSDIFKQGVKRVIEEFNGRYTGCYGCGKCEKGKI